MKLGLSNSINNRISDADWTPASLSGLQAWFKNDTGLEESDTSTPEDGENITKWTDQSSNNNDLTASSAHFTYDSATGSAESGDGTNSQLNLDTQLNFSGEFAMYIRAAASTISSGTNDLFFYDKDTSTIDFFRIQTTTEIKVRVSGDTAQKWAQATQVIDQFYNFGWERDGSNNMYVYRDGSALTATTAISNTSILDIDAIGGNFDGIIKEIIICNSSLSSSDRTNLQTYLNTI